MIAGRTQMNKAHCHPKSIPSAIGTLTAEPAVAKIDIDVVYKLVIKATLAGKFSLITPGNKTRSEEHTSELQSRFDLVCRLLLEQKNILISARCQLFN